MMWEVWRYFSYGWIASYWIEPEFNFTYAGFRWVEPWPGDGMYYHMIGLAILACLIMVGFLYRIATVLFFLGFSYVFLLEKAQYLNHFYFIILIAFLLIFIPAHRAFSVDAYLWPKLRSQLIPAWSVWTLRAQLGIVYFFGGVAKLNADWLRGEPMRLWLGDLYDFPLIGPHVEKEWFVYGMSYGGLLFDLLVVPLLLWKRTRVAAFLAAAFFHIMNSWIFHIGIFPWFSLAATTIFLVPDWPRRAAAWAVEDREAKEAKAAEEPAAEQAAAEATAAYAPPAWEKPVLVLLAVHFAVQLFLPFRHWFYPGNVNWTEEGHRFAWHMKLRSKDAIARFIARDPATGDLFEVDAAERLNYRQIRKMAGRPDMILEFARYIASEMEANGIPNAEVRVRAAASLNGRQPQVFIDPNVNLTEVKWGLAPSKWVLPLHEPLHGKPPEGDGEPGSGEKPVKG
ncbi:MAG: HTTM domain-containing protein, partial [Akkermansiaceae bacterium]|nr:HTTM domain-containing protein [Akkermansiaceae bacterium]